MHGPHFLRLTCPLLAALALLLADARAQEPNAVVGSLMGSLGGGGYSGGLELEDAQRFGPYPVFFWNYGTYPLYERLEKDLFRARLNRETTEHHLAAARARYELKRLHREYHDSRRAPRVKEIHLDVSPRRLAASQQQARALHRPDGSLAWPAVLKYSGFAEERSRFEHLLSLEHLDQDGLELAMKQLRTMENRLRSYRGGAVVVTPADMMSGLRFLDQLQQEMLAPTRSPAAASEVASR